MAHASECLRYPFDHFRIERPVGQERSDGHWSPPRSESTSVSLCLRDFLWRKSRRGRLTALKLQGGSLGVLRGSHRCRCFPRWAPSASPSQALLQLAGPSRGFRGNLEIAIAEKPCRHGHSAEAQLGTATARAPAWSHRRSKVTPTIKLVLLDDALMGLVGVLDPVLKRVAFGRQ
jgi:hypothetical protein